MIVSDIDLCSSKKISGFHFTIGFYLVVAVFCVIGYIFGVLQSLHWNNDSYNELRKCSEQKSTKTFSSKLVVIIFSSPKNKLQRSTVRQTWLSSYKKYSILYYFVIGLSSLKSEVLDILHIENKINNDLLLLSTVNDTYAKLSIKLIEALKWVNQNVSFTFLLKVDDDTFVNVDAFFNLLAQKPEKRLYWGFFDGTAQVKTRGKWAEDKWFLCDTYLPYAKGGGYVITSDLVQFIARNSEYLTMYKSEDVAMGTWLAPLDLKRVHDPLFDTEYRSRGCFNSYIVTHKQSTTMMNKKHQNLLSFNKLCIVEHRNMFSYVYNWKVPPSHCCIRNDSLVP